MNIPSPAENCRESQNTFQIMMIIASGNILLDFSMCKCVVFHLHEMKWKLSAVQGLDDSFKSTRKKRKGLPKDVLEQYLVRVVDV